LNDPDDFADVEIVGFLPEPSVPVPEHTPSLKSRSQGPILAVFVDNVEVLPEPPVHTGASSTQL
jgi:hypothetical protein